MKAVQLDRNRGIIPLENSNLRVCREDDLTFSLDGRTLWTGTRIEFFNQSDHQWYYGTVKVCQVIGQTCFAAMAVHLSVMLKDGDIARRAEHGPLFDQDALIRYKRTQ